MSEELYLYKREPSYLAGLPGIDIERDVLRVAIIYQDLELLKIIARQSVYDTALDKFVSLTLEQAKGGFTNMYQWGGTDLTGRDISLDLSYLRKLDIKLTALGDYLRGSEGRDLTTLQVALHDDGENVQIATAEDISGAGKTGTLKNYLRWTLYLKAADAISITVLLSPDGGTTVYEVPESPIVFSAASDEMIQFGYDANYIKLVGSNGNNVTAQVRGVL